MGLAPSGKSLLHHNVAFVLVNSGDIIALCCDRSRNNITSMTGAVSQERTERRKHRIGTSFLSFIIKSSLWSSTNMGISISVMRSSCLWRTFQMVKELLRS